MSLLFRGKSDEDCFEESLMKQLMDKLFISVGFDVAETSASADRG